MICSSVSFPLVSQDRISDRNTSAQDAVKDAEILVHFDALYQESAPHQQSMIRRVVTNDLQGNFAIYVQNPARVISQRERQRGFRERRTSISFEKASSMQREPSQSEVSCHVLTCE